MPPWRVWLGPLLLAGAGLLLTFTAPPHRPDLVVLGLLGLAAGLFWRPALGPLFIGLGLPFYFFGRTLVGPLSVSPPGLVLLLAWPAALVRCRSLLRVPRTAYDGALTAFLVASLAGLLVSEYPLLSARELRALIFEPVLFFWLLAARPATARFALGGFLTSATLVAAVAIGQVALGIGGTEAEGVRRAQAWYPSPNHLALMLGRAWPLLLALGLGRSRLALLPAAVAALAILLTFSTGGWVGGAAAAAVVLVGLGHRRIAVTLGGAAALALVVASGLAVAGVLPERLNPTRQAGTIRVDLWLSSLAMLRDHPLLGVGLDNFAYLYQQVYIRDGGIAEPNLSHPHNWFLHFWLELGLLGLVAFLWLLARFWQAAARQRGWLVAGAMGAMAYTLVHGLIDQSYFLVDLAYVFWLILVVAAVRIDTE